jgi:AcrR family transcriptional regulator
MKRRSSKLPSRRREPVQARAKVTVEAMLDAAIVILQHGGVAAITTNQIAETAGVSIGSVYQYFPNKHALFRALHERHIKHVELVMCRRLEQYGLETLDDLIREMIDGMVEAHQSDAALSELLQSEVPHRADGSTDFVARLCPKFREALSKFDSSVKPGTAPGSRAFFVASMVEALSHAILLRKPSGLSFRSAKQECCRAIMAYLRS